MDDTLGRVAARTGGIASSYATTAGQQAYGGYMADLEGIARDMYESNKAEMMDERERLYDMQRQERSDALDLYKLRMAADDTDYDRKTAMAKILAGYGDFSLYEELGLNKDQVGNMKAAWDKANAPVEVEQKPRLNAAQADAAIKEGITTPEVIAAYEYYYGAGALGNGAKLMMGGGTGDGGEPEPAREPKPGYDQATVEDTKKFIDQAAAKVGLEQLKKDFAELRDEFTDEEWDELWNYIDSLE
jgi:hypothetical protein